MHSLQKFKLNIANTVITQENSNLLSMNTSDLLDLFQLAETADGSNSGSRTTAVAKKAAAKKSLSVRSRLSDKIKEGGAGGTHGHGHHTSSTSSSSPGSSMKSVLESIPELWSEEQYASEYDLNAFMKSLTDTKQ